MRPELDRIARRLLQLQKSPEELFPFFRASADDVDRGSVVDLDPKDERAVLAGTIQSKDARALRTTKIVSCSSLTHDLYVQALSRAQDARWRIAAEVERRTAQSEKGEKFDASPLPEVEEEKPRQVLAVLQARILAEGIEAFDSKPPTLILDAPSADLKRGAKCPLLSDFLPKEPSDLSASSHMKLLQVVEALPNSYVERVFCGIFWISQLLPARFLPAEAPRGDAGKSSGEPSPTPSSGTAPSSKGLGTAPAK